MNIEIQIGRVMKFGKFNLNIILFFLFMLLYSCSNNPSHKNKNYSFATIDSREESGEVRSFIIDDCNFKSFVAEKETTYKPHNPRVFIEYSRIGFLEGSKEEQIKLERYIYDILTKKIDTISSDNTVLQDSIGHDGVDIISGFAAGNFMTLRFNYMASGENIAHLFSMISLEVDNNKEENIVSENSQSINKVVFPIILDFRHNAHHDKPNYTVPDTYICFDISEYVRKYHNNPALSFLIRWTNYNGESDNMLIKYLNKPRIINH